MPLDINIIGAGNLGKTLGNLFAQQTFLNISGICNSSLESTNKALNFIGAGKAFENIKQLPPADVIFITTKDDVIPDIIEQLIKHPALKKGCVVVHCSGALNSDIFLALKDRGLYTASIHPMQTFCDPIQGIKHFNQTYCAVEGDDEAIEIISYIFKCIGGVVYRINKDKKVLYHLAGVLASNYLITLVNSAKSLLKEAEIDEYTAIKILLNIIKSTLKNIENTYDNNNFIEEENPLSSVLTGPLQRGDITTIQKHIHALNSITDNKFIDLYKCLGKATLSLTSHDEMILSKLQDLF